MAAKKDTTPKTAGPAADKKAALETALAQIEKQFGKGAVMKLGANVTMQVDAIPTGSLGLDLALGIGGVPRGRIVEVYGPESSGKTTLALQILAEAQKMGGEVAFIDVEHALDPTYAAALGVDIDSLLVSQPDTGEQAMEICEALVRSGAIDAVVAEHGQKPAAVQLKAHVAQDRASALVVIAEVVHTDHVRLLPLNSRYKNSGPPRNAVRAPIGRMTGMMTTRATRSLSSSSAAPASTEPGMR